MEIKKWIRYCPICNLQLKYNYAQSFCNAKKYNNSCRSCKAKERAKNEETGIRSKRSKESLPEVNYFKGKKHKPETIEKLKKIGLEKAKYGKDHPCYKKSIYDWWIKKYGKEIADSKLLAYKEIHKINSLGDKNPQYGKPAPNGSGNGWSGWYKGWYFRSLLELSYMIKVIERFNFEWKSGESQYYKIPYIFMDKTLNYFPDFVLNNKYLIEIKPKNLWNTPKILAKKESAINFCKEKGLKYKLVKCNKLSFDKIKELYESGMIKWLPRYEEKYKNYGK